MSDNAEPYAITELIGVKAGGGTLDDEQIDWLVDAFMREHIAPEQMSALLMAILIRGMARTEIRALTAAMIASGETMNLRKLGKPAIDKHSTGGVGDKITLPLVPLVASYGVAVPQLSGRGLGHTGGTLDKLESIPGWRANITNAELDTALRGIGGVICAAGSGLAPADRRLYALRDITGTVASAPLIASSIMSKKIAEGTGGLVLDVKTGSGAFLPSVDQARELAEIMVNLGADSGLETTALITDMDAPLGREVGNACEVQESVDVLQGGGPADVVELTLVLAKEMLRMAGLPDVDPSKALSDGQAFDTWNTMIRSQGGDPTAPLPQAQEYEVVRAREAGYVQRVDARAVGVGAWRLGAGRSRPGDAVDHAAGVSVHVRPGDLVAAGDPLFTVRCDSASRLQLGIDALQQACEFGVQAPTKRPLILGRVDAR